MNVIQITPKYFPYLGGIERVVQTISEKMVEKGINIKVYTTNPENQIQKHEIINDVHINRYKVFSPRGTYHIPQKKFYSDLKKENFDIIHAHGLQSVTTVLGYHAAHTNNSKFVVSPYYHIKEGTTLSKLFMSPLNLYIKYILHRTHGLIVNSQSVKKIMFKKYNLMIKNKIIFDGVDLSRIALAQPFEIEKTKTLICLGRVVKYKNFQLVIKTLKLLPNNYHLYIIGKGKYLPFLEDLAFQLEIQKRVHFLGYIPDEMLYKWLKTADLLLHLSQVESFGMTCLEALAAGTPVIVNNDEYGLKETADLLPDVIKVFNTREDSLENLAKIIIKTCEMKPINVDLSRFSWENITNEYISFYQEILND